MHFNDLVPILQLSVSPVILISGVGLLLLSMTNRFGRVIDRSRQISDLIRKDEPQDFEGRWYQLKVLSRRARLLRVAIIMAVASVFQAALLISSLFVCALLKLDWILPPTLLFLGCMATLVISTIYLIKDINESLLALERELKTDEELCNKKSGRVLKQE